MNCCHFTTGTVRRRWNIWKSASGAPVNRVLCNSFVIVLVVLVVLAVAVVVVAHSRALMVPAVYTRFRMGAGTSARRRSEGVETSLGRLTSLTPPARATATQRERTRVAARGKGGRRAPWRNKRAERCTTLGENVPKRSGVTYVCFCLFSGVLSVSYTHLTLPTIYSV